MAPPPPEPVYHGDAYLPFRPGMRVFYNNIKTEFVMTFLVLINMCMLFVDMAYTESDCSMYGNVTEIQQCLVEWEQNEAQVAWTGSFQYMEVFFLVLFASDIVMRLYAFGISYFHDVLNVIDATIVYGLLILQLLLLTVMLQGAGGGSSFSFLRIVRLVRLVRLFVVMNKVQKAQRAYKKAKYLKLGSPVERVMELLAEFKNKNEEQQDDVADISWIMHLISSDKLYTIDIRAAGGDNLSSEMTAWLENNMGMKKDIEHEPEDGEGTNLTNAVGLKRQEIKIQPGGDSAASKELTQLDEVLMLPEMEYYVSEQPGRLQTRIHDWDLDVFDFAVKAKGYHLVVGVHQLLDDHGLVTKFRLSKHRLLTFLHRIQDGYIPENPYHNSVHALDVALNTNYFCRSKVLSELITPLDRLAAIIAASMHDFGHPGLNSNFLQATKHDFAITYNDQSILESMHVASAWKLLLQDECNFLKGLSKEQYLELRDTVIQLVLATDMKYHFEHYTKFKTKVSSDTFVPGCDREDVKFLLAVAMHTADIANPAKPLKVCLQWTELVMEEFFRQGDLEAKLGMPISPFYDREKTSTASCQMGFINVLVKPLYAEFTALLGGDAQTDCFSCLEANLKAWEAHGNELLKIGAAGLPAGSPRNGELGAMGGSQLRPSCDSNVPQQRPSGTTSSTNDPTPTGGA